jgi:1,4-dihydroxy-2-naphthoate polyprenyltransferase
VSLPGPGVLLRAARAPSLVAGAMPPLVAGALATWQGHAVSLLQLALCVLGIVALQAGVNLANDYFDDASGLDADPEFSSNPFPLGSRAIQTGALSRRAVLVFSGACFATGAACGVWLDTVHPGHTVLALGALGALLGWFYTAPPLRIAYRGAGELVTFALFGPLACLGTTTVLTGGVNAAAGLVSTVVGVLAMAILYMHHFPQHDADRRHGKKTPVVRLGPARAGRLVPVILAVPYALVAWAVGIGALPWPTLAFALTAPLAVRAARTALAQADQARAMTRAFGQVLGVHFFGSLLLVGGLLLGTAG